jgi:hypothetical protein
MKKYTERLKRDLHNYRVVKNYIAAALPVISAIKVLVLGSTVWPVLTAALIGGAITIFGETLYYIGMSWVETAESIQERNEAI